MNTNRLSIQLAADLNLQMTNEANASLIYLSYAAWAGSQGFNGVANDRDMEKKMKMQYLQRYK